MAKALIAPLDTGPTEALPRRPPIGGLGRFTAWQQCRQAAMWA